MMLLAVLLLVAPDPQLPSQQQVEDALIYAWSCKDEDGFTLCDPGAQPRDVEFTRFHCRSEVPSRGERARASCEFEGRLMRHGRRDTPIWERIALQTAIFWIDDRPGASIWFTER